MIFYTKVYIYQKNTGYLCQNFGARSHDLLILYSRFKFANLPFLVRFLKLNLFYFKY